MSMKHLVSQKNDVIVCINKYNVLRNDSDEVLLKQLDSELLLLLLFIHVKVPTQEVFKPTHTLS